MNPFVRVGCPERPGVPRLAAREWRKSCKRQAFCSRYRICRRVQKEQMLNAPD